MEIIDQTGRTISLEKTPSRIISLVPSQTELLFDLGLEDEVVGITKFCIHPESWFRTKTRIGGTKEINFEKIAALKPDLIIANKEENEKEQIEKLCEEYPVWISDIKTLDNAYDMIRALGELTNRKVEAKKIISEIAFRFENFKKNKTAVTKNRVAYFIWKNPWMVAGHDTFIDHLLSVCGFENVFVKEESRYPEITLEDVAEKKTDVILLSSEPYPFKEKHLEELKAILPSAKIMLVDGELFSWYGSRLMHSTAYFGEVLNKIV
ncbi:MAG TPA: helical backbone metal receptor [Bacteroidia bacterium]|jgi:ABC-type Fe3+-hydroxamate transport system substrate-binding protein|nr:helical backbone metal receptor [Bacteroidia bacterium]